MRAKSLVSRCNGWTRVASEISRREEPDRENSKEPKPRSFSIIKKRRIIHGKDRQSYRSNVGITEELGRSGTECRKRGVENAAQHSLGLHQGIHCCRRE